MRGMFDYGEYVGSAHLNAVYSRLAEIITERAKLKIENENTLKTLTEAKMYLSEDDFHKINECDLILETNKEKSKHYHYTLAEIAGLAKVERALLMDENMDNVAYQSVNNNVYHISCNIIENWVSSYTEHLKKYLMYSALQPRSASDRKQMKELMLKELNELNQIERSYTKYFPFASIIEDEHLLNIVKKTTSVIPFETIVASRFVDLLDQYNTLIQLSDNFASFHDDVAASSTEDQALVIRQKIVNFDKTFAPTCNVTNLLQLKKVKDLIKINNTTVDKTILPTKSTTNR